MNNNTIIQQIASEIEARFRDDSGGHDWWHIYRVWKMAKRIAEMEGANTFIVELVALLHDVPDWKFNNGNEEAGNKEVIKILRTQQIEEELINEIVKITDKVSFKGAMVEDQLQSLEGKIVQDADRLDAIGAIGIARTFAYGGQKGRAMHEPTIEPVMHQTFEAYKSNNAPTINHFYEKLLLLKERMNTQTGKQLAEERHRFMEMYLHQFFAEWEGLR